MKDESKVYRAAIKLLQRDGWCKRSNTDAQGRHDILGAIDAAGCFDESDAGYLVYVCGYDYGGVARFNDEECETIDDAIGALSIAADLAYISPEERAQKIKEERERIERARKRSINARAAQQRRDKRRQLRLQAKPPPSPPAPPAPPAPPPPAMKSEPKSEQVLREYWSCYNTEHRHHTEEVATRCIAKHHRKATAPPVKRWTDELFAACEQMRADGMTFESIGEKLGISGGRVSYQLWRWQRIRDRRKATQPPPPLI